jgi:hypothetical protein
MVMQISLPIGSIYNKWQTVRLGWTPAKSISTSANIQATRAILRNHPAKIKTSQHVLNRNGGLTNYWRLSFARVQKQTSGKLQLLPRSGWVSQNLPRHTYKHIAHIFRKRKQPNSDYATGRAKHCARLTFLTPLLPCAYESRPANSYQGLSQEEIP